MQKIAENVVKSTLNEPGDPTAALVSLDPRTGYIKALVGGQDFEKQKYNAAIQGQRQPGSSFKTFVLVTALEKGISPKTTFPVNPRKNRRFDSRRRSRKRHLDGDNAEGSAYGPISIGMRPLNPSTPSTRR